MRRRSLAEQRKAQDEERQRARHNVVSINSLPSGYCKKCGSHIGKGVWMHERNCNGVNTRDAQSGNS